MFRVHSDHPVAADSPDHTNPLGCIHDNHSNVRFVRKVWRLFPAPRVLDLGCAGGAMVADFNLDGASAVGIEGSSLPAKAGFGEWPRLGGVNLFTLDARRPFSIYRDFSPWFADVVTAWEFLEHIDDHDLPGVCANVRRHLRDRGLFVVSIATFEDPPRHRTVRPMDWWIDRLGVLGFVNDEAMVDFFAPDWVRDQGERGFHLALRLRR